MAAPVMGLTTSENGKARHHVLCGLRKRGTEMMWATDRKAGRKWPNRAQKCRRCERQRWR